MQTDRIIPWRSYNTHTQRNIRATEVNRKDLCVNMNVVQELEQWHPRYFGHACRIGLDRYRHQSPILQVPLAASSSVTKSGFTATRSGKLMETTFRKVKRGQQQTWSVKNTSQQESSFMQQRSHHTQRDGLKQYRQL